MKTFEFLLTFAMISGYASHPEPLPTKVGPASSFIDKIAGNITISNYDNWLKATVKELSDSSTASATSSDCDNEGLNSEKCLHFAVNECANNGWNLYDSSRESSAECKRFISIETSDMFDAYNSTSANFIKSIMPSVWDTVNSPSVKVQLQQGMKFSFFVVFSIFVKQWQQPEFRNDLKIQNLLKSYYMGMINQDEIAKDYPNGYAGYIADKASGSIQI